MKDVVINKNLEMSKIDTFFDKIDEYYLTLNKYDETLNFLKKEIMFMDEAIDLINLNLLPLSSDYIIQCRNTLRRSLEKNDFIEKTQKLSIEAINKILSIKKYTEMTRLERNTFDCFICLFPKEVESSDLFVEIFTDRIYAYGINIDGVNFLSIFQKHFSDIIE